MTFSSLFFIFLLILIHPKLLEGSHVRKAMLCLTAIGGSPHRPQPVDLGLRVFQHHLVIAYGPDKGQLLILAILRGAALTGSRDHASVEILC